MPIDVPSEIIELARSGETAHVEALLAAAWPQAYRLARAIVANPVAAEDVAQEACVSAFRTIGSLRSNEAFGTWFYRIVAHEALKYKRAAHRVHPREAELSYEADMAANIDLWRALDALPVEGRAAIVLHYFEGLRSREIAEVLGVADATVRFRLMRARQKLKRVLTSVEPPARKKVEKPYAV